MIIKQYVKDFENLGFGLFVHFGLYSALGKGEWAKFNLNLPDEEYAPLFSRFAPDSDWAENLVLTAKAAGCKYITLTTRHHDGYSLYDTCGLNEYDAPHGCGRDLVREFVDACRKHGIIPFFYHTLLDWHEESYKTDFPTYLKYLRDSVEILCKNYGKIGGLWFDGMWDQFDADWEEDALYATIRKYQPEAMIINNTGMIARGKLGNIELDSITFERGKPQERNLADSPKYIASEMCEVLADHWGYTADDLSFKAPSQMIEELCECRKYGANFLLNIGPMGSGKLRAIDAATLEIIGRWMNRFEKCVRTPKPCDIQVINKEKDFLLQDGNTYYLFCFDLPMMADENVALYTESDLQDRFGLEKTVLSVKWVDSGEPLAFSQENGVVTVQTEAYCYGKNYVVRVAELCVE